MKEFKGTKGRWKVKYEPYLDEESGELNGCSSVVSNQGVITANCYAYPFYGIESIEQAKANALLISKAPEMLELLQEAQASYEKYGHLLNFNAGAISKLIESATKI